MARWREHRAISKLVTGDEHPEVHRCIDWPYWFLGRRHRRLFHDPLSAGVLGAVVSMAYGKDPVSGALAAQAHIIQDHLGSAIRRAIPRPLRFVLSLASGALYAAIEGMVPAKGPSVRTPPESRPPQRPDDWLLGQVPRSWFLTDVGYWWAAIGPAATAVVVALELWAAWWIGATLEIWPEPPAELPMGIAIHWAIVAVVYPLYLRALRRWWLRNQPWRPVRDRDERLVVRVVGDREYVKAEGPEGATAWLPPNAFPTVADDPIPPDCPAWLVVAVCLVALPVVFAVLVVVALLLAGSIAGLLASTGQQRRRG